MVVGASPIPEAFRQVMARWGVTPLDKGGPTSVTRGMGMSPLGSGGKEHWQVGVIGDVPGSSSKKSMVGKGRGLVHDNGVGLMVLHGLHGDGDGHYGTR